jgi:hypothetical protein
VHQVRYWASIRTPGELRRDMRVQLRPSQLTWTLLAYWTMNEGMGRYVADISERHGRCFARGTSWDVSDAAPTMAPVDSDDGAGADEEKVR